MYVKYVVTRLINAVLLIIVTVLVLSTLFSSVSDRELKAQVEEQVLAAVRANRGYAQLNETEKAQFRQGIRDNLYSQYDLDKPIYERIMKYTANILTFNFGKALRMSSRSGSNEVKDIVLEALPRTILLFTTAEAIVVVIGILFGIKAAQRSGSILDKGISVFAILSSSLPMWWVGMLMILIFSYSLNIFPSGGLVSLPPPTGIEYVIDLLWHLTMPLITVILVSFGAWAYTTRNLVIGTMQEDYITVARAKGVPERKVLYGHVLRSSAPPLVTMITTTILVSLGGAIITESVFNWPGMGRLYWVAIGEFDTPVLMGNTFVTVFLYVFAMAVLDLTYGLLDPRIKVGGRR
jgi:peptide/nickel transport system permease protein